MATHPGEMPPALGRDDGTPLYESVAQRLGEQIETGTFRAGDRVPSVRQLSREWRISISSVLGAYRLLENRGLIEARPQSGYYVRPNLERLREVALTAQSPATSAPPRHEALEPRKVDLPDIVAQLMNDSVAPGVVPLAAALPNPELLPTASLHRVLAACARQSGRQLNGYEHVRGNLQYRAQVAQRYSRLGPALSADSIIATAGCSEALSFALRAVCKPGDTVAVESPAYFGLLQAIRGRLRAIEIPTDPEQGMDIDALERAMEHYRVSAVLTVPNFNNPLGTLMPDARKRQLVDLVTRHRIPLIEDDIYGDLAHCTPRPLLAKAFDREDWVVLCSSFSKTLAPGFRIGWIASERFRTEIERIKFASAICTAPLTQLALARFLEHENYDRHLRHVRRIYAQQVEAMAEAVIRNFPPGTAVSQPRGGFVLWVRLPEPADTIALYARATRERITFAPGPIFSASGRYQNFLRLNCAYWAPELDETLATLGRLVVEQLEGRPAGKTAARRRMPRRPAVAGF